MGASIARGLGWVPLAMKSVWDGGVSWGGSIVLLLSSVLHPYVCPAGGGIPLTAHVARHTKAIYP